MKHITQDQRPQWEVVEENVAHGWLATWTVTDEDGNDLPETFATAADAQAALDSYLADYASELDEESASLLCDPDRYRICVVDPSNAN